MTTLNTIQETISDEIRELNNIISSTLSSNSKLLQSVVNEYLVSKGKQIRPILVILSAKIFGEAGEKSLYGAAAVELLHNASLIHDDVVDESRQRRGLPTINYTWDNHIAVLVGDFFVSRALHCAVRTGNLNIIQSMSELGVELSRGEIDQIDNARQHFVNEDKYFEIIRRKTASLFSSCVRVGGYSVDAKGDEFDRLCRYAEILGICFQIRDDIFDYYDDPIIGKPTGNDLREGKITLPLIYAVSKGSAPDTAAMKELVNKESLSEAEINQLISFAKREGGIEYAYEAMTRLRNEANELISSIPQSKALDAFKLIFDYIIERKY